MSADLLHKDCGAVSEPAQERVPLAFSDVDSSINFASLSVEVQLEAERWHSALHAAITGPRSGRGDSIRHAAAVMGVSVQTARRHYDLFRRVGWRGLVNWAKEGKRGGSIPVETVRWLKGLCENYGGNFRQAYNAALAHWRAGKEIPGYYDHPAATVYGYPLGWSYSRMIQLAGPKPVEKMLARVGRSAAKSCMPLVITTRRNLQCGQIYMFDDVWHDVSTSLIGVNREMVRPLELACMDLFSSAKVAYGLKPRIRNEVTGKRVNLRESDMRFMLCYVVTQLGFHQDGCQMVAEHGTAAISDAVAGILYEESGRKITVVRSGIEDKPAILGAWAGNSHGNFRLKAALESSHNLMHNVTRCLPGQTGSNARIDKPEDMAGRTHEFERLVKAIEQAIVGQPPERIAWLLENIRAPFIPYFVYCRIVDELYRIIDGRTNHDLEGWEEAGLLTGQYRLAATDVNWFDDSTLIPIEPEKREAITAILSANAGLHRFRRLSPAEVWRQRSLKRLGEHLIPRICGADLAVDRRVTKRGTIEFEDRDLGPGKFVFVARAVNPYGHEILLRDQETYATFINPFDSGRLFVCDAKLRYIGVCSRQVAVSRADTEAVVRAQGQAAHHEVVRLQEYRLRHEDHADEAEAMRNQNAWALERIRSGAPVTPDERRMSAEISASDVTQADKAAAIEIKRDEECEFNQEQIADLLKS